MIQDTIDLGPSAPVPPRPGPAPASIVVRQTGAGPGRWLALGAITLMAAVLAYDHRGAIFPGQDTTPPAPPSALGVAVKDHYKHGPAGIVAISGRVRSGELKTAEDVVSAFRAEGKPAAEALSATVNPRCDASGKIVDAAGLAEDLKRAGEFAGAK